MKKRLLLLSCLCSAAGLLGCGSGGGAAPGGDVGEIEAAINTSVLGDGPSRCTASTQTFLEQTTHEAGAAALRSCEEAAQDSSLRASSESVSDVKVDGDGASAAIAIHGSALDGQVVGVSLAKDGDGWKLDKITGFVKLDRSALGKVFEEKAAEAGSSRVGSCLGAKVEEAPESELATVLFGKDSSGNGEFIRSCLGEGSSSASSEKVVSSDGEGNGYSFEIPKGFERAPTQEKLSPKALNSTAIATSAASGPASGIAVAEFPAGTLPAIHTVADLKKQMPSFNAANKELGKEIGATISPVDQRTVNGLAALHWTMSGEVRGPYPGTDADVTLVFDAAGTAAAEVACRWGHGAGEKLAIESGCLKVLASLEVE